MPNSYSFLFVYETSAQEAEIFRLYEVDSDADTLLIVRPSSEVTKNSALELNGHKDDGLTNGLSKPHINGQNFSTELRIKNSSMHLSLASRHLSNKIRHNAAVQSGGRIHIPLEDVKPAAAIVPSLLKRVSGIAVPQSTEVVGTYGLPIRQKIINGINRQKQQLLIQAADAVNDALG
ncbi:hypothetical protein MCOR03_009501 [Pyricularia oryzae]|nr:hypothetical protein MCOR24_011066 [Pyricularia oryzae]KAI6550340.1 hypothetical protein MCOR03_009501 [Pyricularia oryzae]KAI6569444.1 hypothetical protein MCOR09_005418 [Pyricularia oryzae]